MIEGECHCGAVRFELKQSPEWLMDCNCSMCRRLGALWAHAEARHIHIIAEDGATGAYVQGDKTLAFHHCRRCGCTTHWENLEGKPSSRMAVNCRLSGPDTIAEIKIRRFDGADSWTFLD